MTSTSPDTAMRSQVRLDARVLLFTAALVFTAALAAAGCTVDNRGLAGSVARSDGAIGVTPIFVVDGGAGTGGMSVVGTGGASAGTGGAVGSGGETASGGAVGSGGSGGGGGLAIGSGGAPGRGGDGPGGRAGAGMGGRTGSGGVGGTCNASNCANGCCAGGTCVTNANRTDRLCGRAGAACAPCDACSQCSALGACDLSPSARWNIICSSAALSPTRPGDVAWDTDVPGAAALADPFCEFVMGASALASTDILTNTLVPTWNQSITPPGMNVTENFLTMQAGRWSVSVTDDDAGVTTNDLACSVTPRLTAADFAAGVVTFPAAQSCSSLTIRLTCAE